LDHPNREDLAESFVAYYAIRLRQNRVSDEVEETILKTIPNRIAYFDEHYDPSPPIVLAAKITDPEDANRRVLFDEAHGGPLSVNRTRDEASKSALDLTPFLPAYGWLPAIDSVDAQALKDVYAFAFAIPQEDLSEAELSALQSYLDAGGRILFFGNRGYEPPPLFAELLESFGVTLDTSCGVDDCTISPTMVAATFTMSDGQCITVDRVEGVDILMTSKCRMTYSAKVSFAVLKRGAGHLILLGDETLTYVNPKYSSVLNTDFLREVLDLTAAAPTSE